MLVNPRLCWSVHMVPSLPHGLRFMTWDLAERCASQSKNMVFFALLTWLCHHLVLVAFKWKLCSGSHVVFSCDYYLVGFVVGSGLFSVALLPWLRGSGALECGRVLCYQPQSPQDRPHSVLEARDHYTMSMSKKVLFLCISCHVLKGECSHSSCLLDMYGVPHTLNIISAFMFLHFLFSHLSQRDTLKTQPQIICHLFFIIVW